ncbi:MAG: hypothetical protein IPL53_19520 [Ignavibacteria bacterium]|nr:hypothetical protein [Ignavibacteria bacterium]
MPDKGNRILMKYYIGKESFKLFGDYIYTSSKNILIEKIKLPPKSIETESLLSDLASGEELFQAK